MGHLGGREDSGRKEAGKGAQKDMRVEPDYMAKVFVNIIWVSFLRAWG